MITFQDYLYEAFDFSYPVKIIHDYHKQYEFQFTHNDDLLIKVIFHKFSKFLHVEFIINDRGYMKPKNSLSDKNSIKIFSTVASELRNYYNKYPLRNIVFSNSMETTVSLYDLMAKRIQKEIGGRIEKTKNEEPGSKKNHYVWKILDIPAPVKENL